MQICVPVRYIYFGSLLFSGFFPLFIYVNVWVRIEYEFDRLYLRFIYPVNVHVVWCIFFPLHTHFICLNRIHIHTFNRIYLSMRWTEFSGLSYVKRIGFSFYSRIYIWHTCIDFHYCLYSTFKQMNYEESLKKWILL